MSDNHFLALKSVVDAVDGSANPAESFTAMIVFFMSTTKTLDLDGAWAAFSNASTILEGGTPSVYDESLPEDLPPAKRAKKNTGSASKTKG